MTVLTSRPVFEHLEVVEIGRRRRWTEDEKLRIVTVLAAIQEHDVASVARLLELPEGTVKSRLHLARKELAERLRWLVNDSGRR